MSPSCNFVRRWDKADYAGLAISLELMSWDSVFSDCADVNSLWDKFEMCVHSLIDAFVPGSIFNDKNRKRRLPNYVKNAFSRKRQLFDTMKKFPSAESKLTFKKWSHHCRLLLSEFQKQFESRFIDSPNSKSFFNYVNSKLSSKSRVYSIHTVNGLTDNDVDKCKAFNDYFSSVFIDDDKRPLDLPALNCGDMPDFFVTRSDIFKVLKSLSNKRSYGPDGIPCCFLKNLAAQLSVPLHKIFSVSLISGKLPDRWKLATVCPLYKGKGNRSLVENYRPISLTSVCCKSMERILKDRLVSHVIGQEIVSPDQHGFLKGKSTQTQLLECLNDWTSAIDQSGNIDAIYLDIKKAFDTVSHSKLVSVLANYGIKGNMLRWITDFLGNRWQRVRINGTHSSLASVLSGVPHSG